LEGARRGAKKSVTTAGTPKNGKRYHVPYRFFEKKREKKQKNQNQNASKSVKYFRILRVFADKPP